MMHMTFYWGLKATILFDTWTTTSWPSYALTLVALFLAAAFYQYMEDRRIQFKVISTKSKPSPSPSSPLEAPFLFVPRRIGAGGWSPSRFAAAVLFGVNSAIGYLLMLAVMSFNGGVFIAIVVGLSVGYLLFRTGVEEDIVLMETSCACA